MLPSQYQSPNNHESKIDSEEQGCASEPLRIQHTSAHWKFNFGKTSQLISKTWKSVKARFSSTFHLKFKECNSSFPGGWICPTNDVRHIYTPFFMQAFLSASISVSEDFFQLAFLRKYFFPRTFFPRAFFFRKLLFTSELFHCGHTPNRW